MAMLNMMAHAPRESFPGYPPQPYAPYQARPHELRPYGSSSPDANAYSTFPAASRQQPYSSPSFPSISFGREPALGDAPRPSLPPISDLLGIADGDRSRNERDIPRSVSRHSHSPPSRPLWFDSIAPTSHAKQHIDTRSHPQVPVPPPFRHDSVEGGRSPSTISTGSTSSLPPHLAVVTVNKLEPMDQRVAAQAQASKSAVAPAASPRENPAYAASSYASSAGTVPRSTGALSVDGQSAATEDASQQRPLPSNFPPAATSPSSVASATSAAGANPWEHHHHHYIGTSSHAAFPQSQDRYICQTCNKAFSRPSSLKIHSHSHTGEKPFRCPHSGCGKAFSVRSNMKRHERGCHTGLGLPAGSTSPLM